MPTRTSIFGGRTWFQVNMQSELPESTSHIYARYPTYINTYDEGGKKETSGAGAAGETEDAGEKKKETSATGAGAGAGVETEAAGAQKKLTDEEDPVHGQYLTYMLDIQHICSLYNIYTHFLGVLSQTNPRGDFEGQTSFHAICGLVD